MLGQRVVLIYASVGLICLILIEAYKTAFVRAKGGFNIRKCGFNMFNINRSI